MGGDTIRNMLGSFPEINKLCNVASCWKYIKSNILTIHGLLNAKNNWVIWNYGHCVGVFLLSHSALISRCLRKETEGLSILLHLNLLQMETCDVASEGLLDLFLIFVVPCIMLYSGEISPTRCNNCVFYSQWLYSTCFGWQSHPSSGVQCYTALYSWWWVRLSPETCRVKPLRIKNAIVASCWTYFTRFIERCIKKNTYPFSHHFCIF